jgi:hypothetical protein
MQVQTILSERHKTDPSTTHHTSAVLLTRWKNANYSLHTRVWYTHTQKKQVLTVCVPVPCYLSQNVAQIPGDGMGSARGLSRCLQHQTKQILHGVVGGGV